MILSKISSWPVTEWLCWLHVYLLKVLVYCTCYIIVSCHCQLSVPVACRGCSNSMRRPSGSLTPTRVAETSAVPALTGVPLCQVPFLLRVITLNISWEEICSSRNEPSKICEINLVWHLWNGEFDFDVVRGKDAVVVGVEDVHHQVVPSADDHVPDFFSQSESIKKKPAFSFGGKRNDVTSSCED